MLTRPTQIHICPKSLYHDHVCLDNFGSLVSNIDLICTIADTANNTQVRQYIVKTLKDLNWDIEEDAFEDDTPYGRKKFTNVIATKDPKASRRVVLAAHFDSKFYPDYPANQVSMLGYGCCVCCLIMFF
jgi:hypothetical protein